jgi:uncharacterized membrane protein
MAEPMATGGQGQTQADELSRWVSRTLAWGTLLAIATVAVGVVLTLASGTRAGPSGTGGEGLVAQIASGKPASIVSLGLLLLALTPVAQLVAAVAAFVRRGEQRYVVVSSVVLALLLVGIVTATIFSAGGGG